MFGSVQNLCLPVLVQYVDCFHHDVQEDETVTEQGTEESVTSEEMENLFEEGADQSVEIQSFRNITEKAEKIMVRVKQCNLHQILLLLNTDQEALVTYGYRLFQLVIGKKTSTDRFRKIGDRNYME